MKLLLIHLAFLGMVIPAPAKEAVATEAVKSESIDTTGKWEVEIPGTIRDGKPGSPSAPPVVPHFSARTSRTFRKNVVESPRMPGLPNVEGRIAVTVCKVVDPGLVPVPKPLPTLPPDDPAVQARLADYRDNDQGTELVLVSATVYDHSRTLLSIYPNGLAEGSVTCWSNIDFNVFSGVDSFRATDPNGEIREYHLVMGIGNEDSSQSAKIADSEYAAPQIPRLRDVSQGPAYVIVKGVDAGKKSLQTLGLIHKLYVKEGTRMEQAYRSRVAEERRLRAYYQANPPKPKDVVINYWRGKRPVNTAGEGQP